MATWVQMRAETEKERMCNVNPRKLLSVMAFALALSFCAVTTARADIISVTYAYSGSVSGNPMNPPLIGTATGSLLPLGSMAWSDMAFPQTGDGTFKMTFTDGDTLFGTFQTQGLPSSPPILSNIQTLTVTAGTGALLYYHGTLTGIEIVNLSNAATTGATISASGGGTLETTPEPESFVLLGTGLASLLAYRKRAVLFHLP
jgi:PEP-CTERM motif